MLSRNLFLLLVGLPLSARAQDVDTFSFSGSMWDRQGTLQVAHPHIGHAGGYYAGLGLTLADDPLVLEYPNGDEISKVSTQFSTRLMGGYNILGFARVDLEVPVYPTVRVDDQATFAMGNVRIGAAVPLLRYEDDGFGIGLHPFVDVPTGSAGAYISDEGVRGGGLLSLGGHHGAFGWALNGGVDMGATVDLIPPSDDTEADVQTLELGQYLRAGLSLNYIPTEDFVLGAEGTAQLPFTGGFQPWNKHDVEAHAYGSHTGKTGLIVTVGGGAGVFGGVGAPDYRVLLAVGYSAPPGPDDLDGDGLADDIDKCPSEPEDKDQFEDTDGCPDLDNDKDGILDTEDACINDPEDFDGFEDKNGCPEPDNDLDGLLDTEDSCPIEKGPRETQGCPDRDKDGLADASDQCPDEPGPRETQGCPDADGDRVPDYRDKCPNQPIDPRADPLRSDGCPARVYVTKAQIMILEKIYFDFNKATIKKQSFELLAEVANVINSNPQIKLIEVAGHTDDVGNDAYNLKLSQARVDAVVNHLVTVGKVDRSRLQPKGYGESKPIDSNATEDGRAMNRRVEFNILSQE